LGTDRFFKVVVGEGGQVIGSRLTTGTIEEVVRKSLAGKGPELKVETNHLNL